MPYLVAIAIQVACLGHAIKTGQERMWWWILLFVPIAGPAAYLVLVVVPDLLGVRRMDRMEQDFKRAVDPEGPLRAAEQAVGISPTPENWRRLATAQVGLKRWAEALASFDQALTGLHTDDPDLLHGRAFVQLEGGDPAGALATLDRLLATAPEFRVNDVALLRGRACEATGRWDEARQILAWVADRYPGEEPRVRLALLLVRCGAESEAQSTAQAALDRAARASADYRADQRRWIEEAKRITGNGVFG